ncbi:MAG: cyclophilin-like fold protein [Magnetospirillum sp.]|nr:cyclophilin-like fold protein [Magnetospirillum sp.]
MRKLRMTIGKVTIDAELLDTPTAAALYAAAPFESRATIWGGEVYFTVPVRVEREEGAREVVEAGELAFRVEGEAVVVAYGPTPNSVADEIRLAMPANIWGRTGDDLRQLEKVEAGELIKVEALV